MTWIKTVKYKDASCRLQKLYERVKGPDDNVDNIMMAHSLRPHTLEGHMAIYKYVLHHSANTLPKWFLEAIGVYTSFLNRCDYCVEHHYEGMKRLIKDDSRSEGIRAALESGDFSKAFDASQSIALNYVHKLTKQPNSISERNIQSLKEAGFQDGEILEINQVTAYFNYANRTVLGLGVQTDGDILGLSPGDSGDMTNWQHK